MGLSLVEMAIGKYPIPPPTFEEMTDIFGSNALADHVDAAKTGRFLRGIVIIKWWDYYVIFFYIDWID